LRDRKDLQEDALLIRQQADRCRDILRDMGRTGKDDLQMRQAPLMRVLEEAAEPHLERGKTVTFDCLSAAAEQPAILRKPEVIHGLRNLIQNAVDFAANDVLVEADWSETQISVRIMDDGTGFPPDVLGRIGDPFMRRRRNGQSRRTRPGYEGMGLGLFIAKTLLERSGAELKFANGTDPALVSETEPADFGAVVEVVWPRATIDVSLRETRRPLGENQQIQV
jgi:two-component system sensor histidine kinase RegB